MRQKRRRARRRHARRLVKRGLMMAVMVALIVALLTGQNRQEQVVATVEAQTMFAPVVLEKVYQWQQEKEASEVDVPMEAAPVAALTERERDLFERLVMAEAGGGKLRWEIGGGQRGAQPGDAPVLPGHCGRGDP